MLSICLWNFGKCFLKLLNRIVEEGEKKNKEGKEKENIIYISKI